MSYSGFLVIEYCFVFRISCIEFVVRNTLCTLMGCFLKAQLIPVVVRLERAVYRKPDIVGLFLCHFRQFDPDMVKM